MNSVARNRRGRWILYARNMINRAIKHIPGEGSGAPAHLVAQPMTHGVATPSRFQIRASFVSGRATQKIQSPFFLTFPLSARDRRSFANNVADRRVPEVSDPSPFLLFFFLRFFFYRRNQSNISHTVIERGEDLYRELKRSWFVGS